MKIYITFGQNHVHRVNNKTFDKDSIAEIECKDYSHGRKIAFELFEDKFATSYDNSNINDEFISYFPRGIIKAN